MMEHCFDGDDGQRPRRQNDEGQEQHGDDEGDRLRRVSVTIELDSLYAMAVDNLSNDTQMPWPQAFGFAVDKAFDLWWRFDGGRGL